MKVDVLTGYDSKSSDLWRCAQVRIWYLWFVGIDGWACFGGYGWRPVEGVFCWP